MVDLIFNWGLGLISESWWAQLAWPVVWTLLKIVSLLLPALRVRASLPACAPSIATGLLMTRFSPDPLFSAYTPAATWIVS